MTRPVDHLLEEGDAPQDELVEELDAPNLGPSTFLSKTLETLAEMDGGVLLQRNDRAPQHLSLNLEGDCSLLWCRFRRR